MTILSNRTLIVVADGGGAILFRNKGTGGAVDLDEERRLSPRNLDGEGPSGSRPKDQTPRQTDEATFAKQLAQALNRMNEQGKFESLVIVADPQTLGQMRGVMHKNVENALVLSLAKDLTGHSADQIAKAIREAA